jgi:hypothetical protein
MVTPRNDAVAPDGRRLSPTVQRMGYVINLRNRTAEVYANPDPVAGTYPPPQIIPDSGTLSLRAGDAEFFEVPLRDVLP